MRTMFVPAAAAVLSLQAAFAAPLVKGSCAQEFDAQMSGTPQVEIDLRAGDIEVVAGKDNQVHVSCEVNRDQDRLSEVGIQFQTEGSKAKLAVEGGPTGNFPLHLRIALPRYTSFRLRAPAGNVTISEVSGDKDIEMKAGNVTVNVGKAGDYLHADGSVMAGNVEAEPFHVNKNGLFRSFNKDNDAGKYRLHAHLLAGNIVFK